MRKTGYNSHSVLRRALRYWPFIVAILITSLASLPAPEAALAQFSDVGFRDFAFGSNCISAPSGEKPESKLWWHDGTWWGNLCHSDGNYHIYRLNLSNQRWEDTGVVIDNRKSDALWDPVAGKLYVVTHVFTTSGASATCPGQCGKLYRFSYNAGSRIFTLDSGFPVDNVTRGKAETVVLAKDSTGQLWVTYVESRKVMVNRSLSSDTDWGVPFQLPSSATAGSVSSDDISSIIAWQGKVGVLWSNQSSDKFYFAVHNDSAADTVWQPEEIAMQGSSMSDDHIYLQSDTSGRIFAAVKTSGNPLQLMLVRQTNGSWANYPFGTSTDSHTRPILVVDSGNNRVHYFATSGQSGGAIYYKSSSTTNPGFPSGKGDIFISNSSSTRINNATSMKANVSTLTGIVVVATDDDYYYHNYMPLDGSPPPTTEPPPPTTQTTEPPPTTPPPTTEPPPTTPPGPVMTFGATDDAMVRSTSPTSNYGSLTTLRARLTSSETINSYLKFNVTGISGPVVSAKLRLYVTDASPKAGSIYRVSNNFANSATAWTEGAINWNNAPPISGSPLSTVGNAALNTWVEFDVTSAIASDGIVSFAIGNADSNSVLFGSSEASSNRPELIVNVNQDGTPPPTTPPPTTPPPTTPPPTTPPPTTSGPQMNFSASDDAQVKSANPTSKYGSLTTLRTRTAASDTINSYLKFSVTGTGGAVSRATLRLFVTDASPDGGAVYLVSNNLNNTSTPWTQAIITWSNAPAISGAPVSPGKPVVLGTWAEWDVTSAITGDGIYSFAMHSNDSNSALYASSEDTTNPPVLVIETGSPSGTIILPTESQTPTATPTQTPTPTQTATPPVSPTPADQVVFAASDDAQLKSANPSSNYGSLSSLRARTTSSETIASILKFNVTGSGGPAAGAILRLYVTDSSPDSGAVYLVANDLRDGSAPWTEGNVNWNNAPAYGGAPIAQGREAVSGGWVEWDVTSAITGDGIYSFVIVSNSTNSVLFNAKEAGENAPALIVDFGSGSQTQALQTFSLAVPQMTESQQPAPEIMPAAIDREESALDDQSEGGQVIESDSALVTRTNGWVASNDPSGASGGGYLVNTSPDDSLTLNFSGTRVEVAYVANLAYGPFIVEIDGQPTQAVLGSGRPDFQFDQRVVIEGLSDSLHTLRIVPMNSVAAIDYFIVYVPAAPVEVAQVVVPPVAETTDLPPAPGPTDTVVETPLIPETAVTPDVAIIVEPPVVVLPPTATPTPPAVPLPFFGTTPGAFAIDGAWLLAEDGHTWHVDGAAASLLSVPYPLDLRGAQQPAARFQSWLLANNSVAGVEVSLDAQSWQLLAVAPPTGDWQTLTLDLSAFRDQSIWLRWVWLPQAPLAQDPVADMWELQLIEVVDLPPATPVTLPPTVELPTIAPPTPEVIMTEETAALPVAPVIETTPAPTEMPTIVLPTLEPTTDPALSMQPQNQSEGGQGLTSLPEQAAAQALENALGGPETTETAPGG